MPLNHFSTLLITNVITPRLFQHYDPNGPNPAHIYRQPTGVHTQDVQDAVMYKQDCGHFFPCVIKMQTANRYAQTRLYKMQLCSNKIMSIFPMAYSIMQTVNKNAQTRLYKMQDAVMLKQDCEHISHGIFNYADRKHKCKHVIKYGVNHKATWRSRNYALFYACICNHKVIMSQHTK